MRRLLTWLVVTLGIAALARRLRRRREAAQPVAPAEQAAGDPAEELRRKLAESRQAEQAEQAEAPAPAGSEQTSAAPAASVEERRAEVHEQGRAALEAMRSTDPE
ncbi:MAG TPA: hypothetical protein VNK94_09470 [Gaiellaceae bacterium]|jgi:hypothetical protein|nr:hypothetical protein [Gaiellaceae bacterium]